MSAWPNGARGKAAGSGRSGLQVLAPFPKPVEDVGVAGGKGHLQVRSWFGGGLIEDGVDEPSPSADGQVAGLYVKVDVDRALVGIGVHSGLRQEAATVSQGDVFGCAGHVGSRAVVSTAGMDCG